MILLCLSAFAQNTDITLPSIKELAPIDYPMEAVKDGIEATVGLILEIDAEGSVVSCAQRDGNEGVFEASACRTMRKSTFNPALNSENTPIPIAIEYRLQFKLSEIAPLSIVGTLRNSGTKTLIKNQRIKGLGPVGQQIETVTNDDAQFQFRGLEDGVWTLAVPTRAYNNSTIEIQVVDSQVNDVEWYVVKDKAQAAKADYTIIIEERKDSSSITERALSRDEILYFPGSAGDVVKAVQNLPGIARAPLGTGQLIIRGTSPEDSSYYIDGVHIPDVFHFGGLTTVINPDAIEEVAYLPGNYSVRYGRQLGGLLDLRTNTVMPERNRSYVSVDVFQSTAFTEQKINDKWAVSFSGRRSYADVILSPILSSGDTTVRAPRYYDAQTRLLYKPDEGEILDVLYFMSDDEFRFLGKDADGAEQTAISFGKQFHKVRLKWLRNKGSFKRETIIIGGPERQDFEFQVDGIGFERTLGFNYREEAYQELSESRDVALRVGMDLNLGIDEFLYDFPDFPGEPEGAKSFFIAPSFYLEQMVKVSRATIIPGLRVGSYTVNNSIFVPAVDPRLSGRFDVSEFGTMKFGLGTFSQYPTPRQLIPDSDGNSDLLPARSFQYSIGWDQQVSGSFRAESTAFYNELDDLVVGREDRFRFFTGPPPIGPFDTDPYANEGTGNVYGLETLLRYDGTNTLALLSLTLSRSFRTSRNGEEQLFTYDQPIVLNALATRQLPKNWRLGARYRYGSGNPYTPVVNRVYDLNSRSFIPVYGDRDSARLAPFKSLDIRIDKDYVYDKWTLTAYLDIQNAAYSKNVELMAWTYDYGKEEPIQSNPPLPAFGFKGEW